MDNRYIIALEISGSQVKGALATVSPSTIAQLSTSNIETIVFEDKTNCVKYGRVQNVIDAATHLTTVVRKLENDPALKGGKIVSAYVGLAGRSLGSVSTCAELTLPSEMEISEEIIKRLYMEATKTVPEDKPTLKILPRKFIIDNQVAANPIGALGSHLRGEFTVVTCNNANRRNLELVLDDRLHLHVKDYIITPLALADLLLGQEEKQLGCVLVDMGAQTTTIAIYKERALQHLVTLPLGGYNITHDIALGLNNTEERAEMAKLTQGDAMPEPSATASEDSLRVNSYVQARVGEIVANILNQIETAGYKAADLPGGFILTGRATKLKNLPEYIEKQTKMKVRRTAINATVKVGAKNVDPADYASLIAIVAQAAKYDDPDGCVDFPTIHKHEPQERIQPQFDPFHENGEEDMLLIDDDKADQLREAQARERQREQERREREERNRNERAEKAEERRQQKEEEEEKRRKAREEQQRKPRRSILSTLKDQLNKVFASEDDGDTDLDNNM